MDFFHPSMHQDDYLHIRLKASSHQWKIVADHLDVMA
jgi:hypothetical protein